MRHLTESERTTVVNALVTAQMQFRKDAKKFRGSHTRLAEAFDRQVQDVDLLIDMFAGAESIVISP